MPKQERWDNEYGNFEHTLENGNIVRGTYDVMWKRDRPKQIRFNNLELGEHGRKEMLWTPSQYAFYSYENERTKTVRLTLKPDCSVIGYNNNGWEIYRRRLVKDLDFNTVCDFAKACMAHYHEYATYNEREPWPVHKDDTGTELFQPK